MNNVIFSLLLSVISITFFYLISEKDEENNDNLYQNILYLFGIIFITSFLLKTVGEKGKNLEPPIDNIINHSSRAPF
jgi:hypothetical protein